MPTSAPQKHRVLVVDDEPGLRQMLEILLSRGGYEVVSCPGHAAAVSQIATSAHAFPVILSDLVMPDGSGMDVLSEAKRRDRTTEVILMTAHSTIDNAIAAMRSGAFNFVTKPFDPDQLLALVNKAVETHELLNENARLRARVEGQAGSIVGKSAAMRRVFDLIGRVASTKTTILITGESGTGKERIARAVHDMSERRAAPFLVVNCGALPENLMESELFGHEKGAFTGAIGKHLGLFREADGGTVLLDEVGELPLALQVKLLRVLQERAVRPVGASSEISVDVRVLAATNRDIEQDVRGGLFRQDLYYRLNVIRLELPPLRERREDIPLLVERFVQRFALEMGKDVRGLTADAARVLEHYAFPGNVRELENMCERAVALAGGTQIGLSDLPAVVSGMATTSATSLLTVPAGGCDLEAVLAEVERHLLVQALDQSDGVRTQAAALLRITSRSLRYRLAKHGFGDDEEDVPSD
jgi:two-component system response regulator PilR (NtrC family)